VPTLVVHVAGAVRSPGVYRLAPGSRIHDAIAVAGGASPDADLHRLNLAAPLEDGVRILVPLPGDAVESMPSSAPGGATTGPGTRGKINVNTASAEDLAGLPRVGPVLAQRIVEHRSQHGRFSSPEDLDAVPGIGTKMLESLLPLVTV
jgi:competence protein ComEA